MKVIKSYSLDVEAAAWLAKVGGRKASEKLNELVLQAMSNEDSSVGNEDSCKCSGACGTKQ